MLIRDLIIRNSRRYPDKIGFIFNNTRYTFKQLNNKVNQLATALLSLGMKKGDRFAILADNCPEYFEIAWTGAKTGIIYVPINTMLTDKEIAYIVNHTEASALFFGQNYSGIIDNLKAQLKSVKHFICIDGVTEYSHDYRKLISTFPPQEPQIELSENDLFSISYTSGTTGLPKGVMLSNKNWLATGANLAFLNEIKPTDILLGVFSFSTTAFPYGFLPAFYVGATFAGLKETTVEAILNCIQREKVTILFSPPALLISLIEYPELGKYDLSCIRRVHYAGSPMPIDRLKKLLKIFEGKVTQNYGLTECRNLTWIYAGELVIEGKPTELRRLASCGREALNAEVRVVNELGNDVVPGEIGEIIGKSDELMVGYWKMPEATALAIKNGYLYTGDMGTIDEDGYIYLSDRKKDMILSQGYRLFPREIEEVIYCHPAVLEAAVVGIPDKESGEVIRAFVVLKPQTKVEPDEIRQFCEQRLPPYAVPKSIEFVSEIPKNPTGKILRRVLREKYLE